METLTSARTPALKSASAMHPASVIEVPACVIEGVVIGEDSAVGNVGVMVVNNRMVSPVGSPMVPAPAEPAKIADSKAKAKRDPRARKEQSWIRIPTRPNPDRLSIRKPGIVLRHVNHLRVAWFDHNRLSLLRDLFLRCALQVPGLLRTIAH